MQRRAGTSVIILVLLALVLGAGGASTQSLTHGYEAIPPPPEVGYGETEADEIEERTEFFYSERAFPNMSIPPESYARSAAQARALKRRGMSGQKLTWRPLGPLAIEPIYEPIYQGKGPVTGRITSIATHPTDPNIAYVAGATGGVWKTVDGGRHWTPTFDEQPTLAVGAVAIDVTNPQTIYAGTGEGNQYYIPYFGMGLFRSTDGAKTWRRVKAPFAGCYFTDLVASRGSLLASMRTGTQPLVATQGRQPACAAGGVWRSEDRGKTWTNVLPGIAWELAQDETDPNFVYAGVDGKGVFKSSDAGRTWTPSLVGIPVEGESRVAVAVAPSDGRRLYAAIERPLTSDLMGLWVSEDRGTTWLPVPYTSQPCSYSGLLVDTSQCFYNFVLAVDGEDPSIFYLGGVKLFRYTLGQPTPRNIGNGVKGIHVDQHALVSDAAGRMWIGNDGGVYRTSDGGETFVNLNKGLALTQFYPGISGSTAGPLLGGSQDNGTSMYSGRSAWKGVLGADGGYSAVDHRDPQTMYGSYQNLNLWKSLNGGKNWASADNGIVPNEPRAFIAPLVMHPRDSATLFAGTVRVYRTADAAERWNAISPVLDGSTIRAIGPAASDRATIYAGTSRGVFVTRDEGMLWVNTSSNGLPLRRPTDFWVHPEKPEIAYVTLSGFESSHVFKTSDAGGSWTDISGKLPDSPANAIELDMRTSTLYVATDVGIFSSTNDGKMWQDDSRGLPNTVVSDLLLDPQTGSLVAGTYGRGMWVARIGEPRPQASLKDTKTRVVVRRYEAPAVAVAYPSDRYVACHISYGIGCIDFPVVSKTRAVNVEIVDDLGQPVAAYVWQYTSDDYISSPTFCGKTDKPVILAKDLERFGVDVVQGPCPDGTPAASSRGEIRMTYLLRR